MDENSKDTVWWNTPEYPNDNHPMKEDVWATVKDLAKKELCNKKLFVSRCILWSKQGYTYGSSFHR